MTRCLAAVLLNLLFASCAGAADAGFYIGAGVGHVSIEDQADNPGGGTLNFDSRGTLYKAFVGYRARAMPLLDLAAEAGWVDYGRVSQAVQGQNLEYRVRGGEAAGLAIVPLGPIDLYGKAGVLSWSSSKNVGGTTTTSSGTNGFYGVGVGFRADKLGVRAEYDYYDVSAVDRLRTYTLSFVIRFY